MKRELTGISNWNVFFEMEFIYLNLNQAELLTIQVISKLPHVIA